MQIGKEAVKLLLFAYDMIIYISDPKNSTQGTPTADKYLPRCGRIQDQLEILVALLYTKDKKAEKEIRETSPFTIATNNIKIS